MFLTGLVCVSVDGAVLQEEQNDWLHTRGSAAKLYFEIKLDALSSSMACY